jgi:hypothetical protein
LQRLYWAHQVYVTLRGAHVSCPIANKRQNLLHYASQPFGQRLFYNQTFSLNPYSFGVKDGVAAQLLLLATRAAQKP